MGQTKEGALQTTQRILAKDPDFYRRIGAIGGKKGTTGGFYYAKMHGLDWHKEAGRKGGKISKRKKQGA